MVELDIFKQWIFANKLFGENVLQYFLWPLELHVVALL